MERVGREAGVSKALVHAYFPRRTDLLRALLLREYRRFQSRARALLANVKGFEQTVRATTSAFLDHVAERGALIELLMHEPDVAAALGGVDAQERMITAHYFGGQMAAEYGLQESTAVTVADLLMGLTGAAGNRLHRTECGRDELLELVLEMIFAALDDISQSENHPPLS
jgi:AcrR family transcriptional regulator